MDDELSATTAATASSTTTSPSRHASPKRLRSRLSRRESSEELRQRLKSEIHLTKELIDFDVIKGSAFFHTKPANHDRRLVQEGFRRALLLPLYPTYWTHKPRFYELSTALYLMHLTAIGVFVVCPATTSGFSAFEATFPVLLLVTVSIAYGRVMSTLQAAGDADPTIKLCSPTKSGAASPSTVSTAAAAVATAAAAAAGISLDAEAAVDPTAAGLGSDIAHSEESDSTDSGDESGNSSSSSDEATPEPHASAYGGISTPRSMPATPNGFPPEMPTSPRTPRAYDGVEHFARRRVTVCVWEDGVPRKKAMSVAELRNTILAKVKATPPRVVYRKIAFLSATTLSLVPLAMRLLVRCNELECFAMLEEPVGALIGMLGLGRDWTTSLQLYQSVRDLPVAATFISTSCMLSTYHMASIIFAALADAEVTYHRRLMYAKCFTALTSARRSRLNNLPHFRLKNVVNIKAWISLRGGRTWLKRQGRQRAADEIVSTSFLINMVLLAVMGMQAVSENTSTSLQHSLLRIEVTIWCLLASMFMLRFMMLGSHINKKYQNSTLLLTEQMNVYLRLLVKPHKKEKLLVSNNVLKLASKLLKELNSPNKVSGLTMNPLLYNITRVVVLSAFSSTASEFFGFKLKLWKMKHI